jgi:hypothetical protein
LSERLEKNAEEFKKKKKEKKRRRRKKNAGRFRVM